MYWVGMIYPKLWFKESVMKKSKIEQSKATRQKNNLESEKKQNDMIRDLQSIFCKGRYHSWVIKQGK